MGTDRKVRLVATESQKYGTRQLRPGDEYDADIYDAADMLAMGIARTEEDVAIAVARETTETGIILPGQPIPKPLSVKQATKRPAKPVKPKRKYVKSGLYKRRDMRAED